jgi:hypothetical protein
MEHQIWVIPKKSFGDILIRAQLGAQLGAVIYLRVGNKPQMFMPIVNEVAFMFAQLGAQRDAQCGAQFGAQFGAQLGAQLNWALNVGLSWVLKWVLKWVLIFGAQMGAHFWCSS